MRNALRLPGRVYGHFAIEAHEHLAIGRGVDLCDALSRPHLKRRGTGYSAFVFIEPEQVIRLAAWIGDDAPKRIRDYGDAMIEQAQHTTSTRRL